MYYYIVNPNAGNRSFADVQTKLKAKLHQLKIDGEFAKTLGENDAQKITRAALKRDVTTIVVAGGDKTVNEVITTVHESGNKKVSVGIIPLGSKNTIASYLGIQDWQHACELLAARRLQSFNLIHVNDYSFLHSCVIKSKTEADSLSADILLEIDGTYKLKGQVASCEITNQKLQDIQLPNSLLLRLHPSTPRVGWWSKLFSKETARPFNQLHGRLAIIEFDKEHAAIIDGRKFDDKLFRFRLSQIPVQLITAKRTPAPNKR